MTHKTKGIVLRSIKYGETSLVVWIFTEQFGIQSYMVNGVRTSKAASAKAVFFQPAAQLDMVVYHKESASMQRIKEFGWAFLYREVLNQVIKNSIASFMVELLQKCLKQPEANNDLFNFFEDALQQLDTAGKAVTANYPLFIALHLPHFFGFRMTDNFSEKNNILDLREGVFTNKQPVHPHFIEGENARLSSRLLRVMHPQELDSFTMNREGRRQLLMRFMEYYSLHIPDFGQMKTLIVLHEVLGP